MMATDDNRGALGRAMADEHERHLLGMIEQAERTAKMLADYYYERQLAGAAARPARQLANVHRSLIQAGGTLRMRRGIEAKEASVASDERQARSDG